MINESTLKRLLGKPITDPGIVSFMADLGIVVSDEAILPEDEYTAYIERKEKGYCFIFTDEAMFLNIEDREIGLGPLFLTGVFFYSEGKDGYSAYPGPLPDGLKFEDSRVKILHDLGAPTATRVRDDGSIIGNRWEKPDYSISVSFSRNDLKPVLVTFFVRNKE